MEEQLSLLGNVGITEPKKHIKPEVRIKEKAPARKKERKRSLDEILEESIRNLENDQCVICGTYLEAYFENGEEVLYCPEDGCTFKMRTSQVPIILKKGRMALSPE